MRSWCLSVRLSFLISLSGCLSIVAVSSVWAGEKQQDVDIQNQTSSQIRQLSEIELPTTNAQLLVQSPTPSNPPVVPGSIVTITGVKANPTDKGVEVILETTLGEQLQVINRSAENNFIADIPNAQLRLSSGEAFTFRSEKPVEGITEITVTNIDANTVRVAVVGENALPTVELFDDDAGLVLAVASTATAIQPPETPQAQEEPAAQEDEPIELVVTGERDSYRVPNASTATRTDTPLRDIPQSIQVVPRQVIEDRGIQRQTQALETISGLVEGGDNSGFIPGATDIAIRGFSTRRSGNFRDGLQSDNSSSFTPIGAIEQIEVLKGPASVLFGALEPGGVINFVTKKPLSEPYYKIGFEVGNYGFYQPSIDLSGPLNEDKTVLYRLIAAYGGGGDFKDFTFTQKYIASITPSISFKLGDRTNLNLFYEYGKSASNPTYEPLRSDDSLIPRNVTPYYFGGIETASQRFGYTLNHAFNDDWQLRNSFTTGFSTTDNRSLEYGNLLNDRFLTDYFDFDFVQSIDKYLGVIDVVGNFKTGSVSHQLVVGFDFNREVNYFGFAGNSVDLPPLDILNPNYRISFPVAPLASFTDFGINQSYGFYLQDQISFTDNLKMLIGGRYDWITNEGGAIDGDKTIQNDGAFSPRIGLVYQPSKTVSLYTSYSQSFRPSIGRNPDNKPFEPTRGTQYEVGVKADFLDGRLSATLAAYNLTRTNVLTSNPDPDLARQGFQVQVGEQRSRGIELDVTGEILPGWNVVASYALTDAEVTRDNAIPSVVGSRLTNIPLNQASLWTTYFIQTGDLQGLGFGLGLFYVGERQANLENSSQVSDYLRTDAAIYYRRDNFNAAINVRNLFNTDYVGSANFGTLFVNRGNPLTIVGSVSWEF
ncbi:TonB-dependent siderophore receptor [Anabaena sp. CCY 0017]|uniref:TonB-dependent siderophore receptor n=1 Tax=Anabaena sp. CCY 0017 TaxID=3103866 RepID=UPI0039C668FA